MINIISNILKGLGLIIVVIILNLQLIMPFRDFVFKLLEKLNFL